MLLYIYGENSQGCSIGCIIRVNYSRVPIRMMGQRRENIMENAVGKRMGNGDSSSMMANVFIYSVSR